MSEKENSPPSRPTGLRPADDCFRTSQLLQSLPSLAARGPLYIMVLALAASAAYISAVQVDVVFRCPATAQHRAGIWRVTTDHSGYLVEVSVTPGQVVQRGTPLFRLHSRDCVQYLSKAREIRVTLPLREQDYRARIASANTQLSLCTEKHEATVRLNDLKLRQHELTTQINRADLTFWKTQFDRRQRETDNWKALLQHGSASRMELEEAQGMLNRAKMELDKLAVQQQEIDSQHMVLLQEQQQELKTYQESRQLIQKEIQTQQLEMTATLESMKAELARNEQMLSMKRREGATASRPSGDDATTLVLADGEGTVLEVFHRCAGEFLAENEPLCTIVPAGEDLYMEIAVPNREAGRLERGMAVRYKFDAYPFADYGACRGQVEEVSASAITPPDGACYYRATGRLASDRLHGLGRQVRIRPGMTATAELVTERRTILSLLVKSLRE